MRWKIYFSYFSWAPPSPAPNSPSRGSCHSSSATCRTFLDFARTWNDIYSEFYAIFYSSYTILKQFTCDDEHHRCESEKRIFVSVRVELGEAEKEKGGTRNDEEIFFRIFSTTSTLRCVKIVFAIYTQAERQKLALLLPPSHATLNRHRRRCSPPQERIAREEDDINEKIIERAERERAKVLCVRGN